MLPPRISLAYLCLQVRSLSLDSHVLGPGAGGACDSVVLRLRSQAFRESLLTRKFCSQSAIEHQVAAKNLEQCYSRLGGSSNNNNKEDF